MDEEIRKCEIARRIFSFERKRRNEESEALYEQLRKINDRMLNEMREQILRKIEKNR